jgi:predicted RNase H-like HicB family nuclease
MQLTIEVEQEEDSRWLAEVLELPRALTYGRTRQEAVDRAHVLCLRILADRLEHGEAVPQMN